MRSRAALASVTLALSLIARSSLDAGEPDITLKIAAPSVELTSRSEFDAAVLLDTTNDGVQGWSLGVAHDDAVLELTGSELGSTTATINNGGPPEFFVLNTEPAGGAGVTLGVILSFGRPVTLPVANDQELLTMSYRVVADPGANDPCEPIASAIAFSNKLGDPPVQTVVTVAGQSQTAALVDATIVVRCPGNIEITRCEGDTEDVFLEWTFGGPPEWDFLFLYRDGDLLSPLDVDAMSYTDEDLEPGDYEYTIVTFVVDDPANPSLIFAHCIATVIPVTITGVEPTIGDWLGGDTITVTGLAFTTAEDTTVEFFAEGEDPLPLEVLEVIGETELTAVTPESPRLGRYSIRLVNGRGAAELADAYEYGFIRGEMNSQKPIDVSDPTSLLNYLFRGEGSAPRCMDGADVTDDGQVNISDASVLLHFLFLDGVPPRAPYPDPGRDPTSDSLGCLD